MYLRGVYERKFREQENHICDCNARSLMLGIRADTILGFQFSEDSALLT